MKKLISILLVLAMVFSFVAVTAADDSVTINVVTSYGGDDGNRKNFEAAVKAYEEATGNKVNDGSATSNEDWKAKVLTDFETGSEPDVLFYFTNADAEPFVSAGKVVSIEEIRKEYPEYAANMKDSMMAVAADGKQYSVPSSGYWENMFVNKKVLEDCGVAIPGPDYTWDQFLQDCETIKANGFTPIACSLVEVPHYWFEFMVMNNGTVANHLDVPASVEDEAGQKWVKGLNDIKDLYERGFFPANTLTASDAETVELFNAGDAAFLIDGSWKVGYFTQNAADINDFAIAYVPGKGDRKASEAIGGISMGYFITTKAWNDPAKREAAVKFVEYLTSDEVLSTFVTTEVTALANGAKPAGLNPLQQSAADTNANVTAIAGAVQDLLTAEARGDLFANIQNIVTGKITAEDALAAALALNK
ncbi:MAG: extracellular solute-binding protein [Clostridia bacterium]|jgi:raffinose/stachyose/melibiose transport system substrate-binding protein|nr:extracellular solute-binding protein [Clostridia bacterium]MBR0421835.1 extracellular solute-binding protein [Clostridia bacterium]